MTVAAPKVRFCLGSVQQLGVVGGLPHVIEAAPRLARFDRDAEYAYAVQAATAPVLDRVRAAQA